jgi:hypothetical protein
MKHEKNKGRKMDNSLETSGKHEAASDNYVIIPAVDVKDKTSYTLGEKD